jgi:dihydrofolate synthase/folylpolyglutamate synthase
LGGHQVQNAATAYAALRTLEARGLTVGAAAITHGFARATWPGRFEVLRRDPPLVVDSAHNRDSARKLRQAIGDYFPGKRVILVFGASEDKDIAGMFAELLPGVDQLILTRSFHPRAADMDMLMQEAGRYLQNATVVAAIEDALAEALRRQTGDDLVLVAGSIFIAAGARETWYNQLKLGGGHL